MLYNSNGLRGPRIILFLDTTEKVNTHPMVCMHPMDPSNMIILLPDFGRIKNTGVFLTDSKPKNG